MIAATRSLADIGGISVRRSITALLCVGLTAVAAGAAQAQISDDVVKIGVLTDMSSVYADGTGKGSLLAAQMAAEDFGASVKGKKIEVIGADHQNKPDVGVGIVRGWFENEHVDAIADVPTSSIALAVSTITREKNKVFLVSGGGTSDLTGPQCSPNTIHWTYDTYALSNVAGKAMIDRGEDTWFFLTADYAFGQALERDASNVVKNGGGKVVGSVRHPLNTSDFASFLVQAQSSKAKVIALANAGGDASNAVKQAGEFGILAGGQKMLALLMSVTDAHALGLQYGQGLILTEGFYWNKDDETRAFSKRYFAKIGRMPTMYQAGVYSAVMHYLKAIDAAGTDEAKAVIARMKATPVNDFFAHGGNIREDGRMVHDMYLVQLKKPGESKDEWDIYNILATIPGDQAFRPLNEGNCPLVQK
jgi:branched-chain amino acid transport system substrate-binding protein